MSGDTHPFEALIERELRDAERVAREDDERMAAAARGEPFWGVGKTAPPPGALIGLYDAERHVFDFASDLYSKYREDLLRLAVGLPARHRQFNGPTPRTHYSRRERRRRKWL